LSQTIAAKEESRWMFGPQLSNKSKGEWPIISPLKNKKQRQLMVIQKIAAKEESRWLISLQPSKKAEENGQQLVG